MPRGAKRRSSERIFLSYPHTHDRFLYSATKYLALCLIVPKDKVFLCRRSYMSAHVLLNLLNELRKRDKVRGLLII